VSINRKDALAGLVFTLFGLFFVINALMNLPLGSLSRMGPAFFPVLLGSLLVFLGLFIAGRSFVTRSSQSAPVPWRGMILVLLAPVAFALTVRGAGVAPAFALAVLISAFANRRMRPMAAILLIVGLTVFCIALFKYGLGMPLDIVGPWFEG